MELEHAVKYISNTSEPTNRVHWFLIGAGLFWYIIAITTTYFFLSERSIYAEVNPLATTAFFHLGMIPTFLIMLVVISIAMIYIPYKFRENKKVGIICNSLFTLFFFLDGGHNAYTFFDGIIPLEIPYRITENIVMYLGLV